MSEKNIKKKITCLEDGCKITPHFNFEGETKRLYCSIHKKQDMINIGKHTCLEVGCKVTPSFNFEGETKRLYCTRHKKNNMINLDKPICLEDGCKITSHFNFEGETKRLYCSIHKKNNMINLDKHKPTCLEDGCKIRANFNFEGETKRLYCLIHKKNNMINLDKPICLEDGCKIRANFNFEGETKGIYCSIHKKNNMMNVNKKTCKSEWCDTQVRTEKYDDYCLYCYINLFPDKPVSRNYKTKEFSVVEFVKKKFSDLDWISDKIINEGCSKKRPDLLLDLGYQILIIEIDENQHKSSNYDCSCENKRIMELSADMGHRPIVFIRFNPDTYIKDGTKITSCWGINEKGICVIKKSKTKEWKDRLNTLEHHITYWLSSDNITNKTIETIELYYDT